MKRWPQYGLSYEIFTSISSNHWRVSRRPLKWITARLDDLPLSARHCPGAGSRNKSVELRATITASQAGDWLLRALFLSSWRYSIVIRAVIGSSDASWPSCPRSLIYMWGLFSARANRLNLSRGVLRGAGVPRRDPKKHITSIWSTSR